MRKNFAHTHSKYNKTNMNCYLYEKDSVQWFKVRLFMNLSIVISEEKTLIQMKDLCSQGLSPYQAASTAGVIRKSDWGKFRKKAYGERILHTELISIQQGHEPDTEVEKELREKYNMFTSDLNNFYEFGAIGKVDLETPHMQAYTELFTIANTYGLDIETPMLAEFNEKAEKGSNLSNIGTAISLVRTNRFNRLRRQQPETPEVQDKNLITALLLPDEDDILSKINKLVPQKQHSETIDSEEEILLIENERDITE